MTNKEFANLFKYLQSICHIWDNHELGLVKKERALQELLQDCRKDHDNDNQVSIDKKQYPFFFKISIFFSFK
jgi:hypothetical protein